MKKEWNTPVLDELDMKETAGGGKEITSHDGVIYQTQDGTYVEEYEAIDKNS